MELVSLGGPVILVLLGASVIGLSIVLFKLVQYRRHSNRKLSKVGIAMDQFVAGDSDGAVASLRTINSPVAEVLIAGIGWLGMKNAEESAIREELSRRGRIIVVRVESLNSYVELIAYLAPMMGLLGTILGMIDVFYGLANESSGDNSGILAGGIWEALTTTAVGLVVAIPFAILHSLLDGRAESIRRTTEDLLTRLFTAKLPLSDS